MPVRLAAVRLLPRCRELDVMDGVERARDEAAERGEPAVEAGVEVGAARLIVTVIKFFLHRFSPLLACGRRLGWGGAAGYRD